MNFQRRDVGPPRSFSLPFFSTVTVPKRPAAAPQLLYFCLQIQPKHREQQQPVDSDRKKESELRLKTKRPRWFDLSFSNYNCSNIMIIALAFYYINLKPKVYIFRQYVKKHLHGLYKAVAVLFQSFMIRAT